MSKDPRFIHTQTQTLKSHRDRFLRKGNVYCISFFQVNSLTPPVSRFPTILRGGSIWEILLWWRLNIFLTMFLHVFFPPSVLGFLFFFLLFLQIKFYLGQNEDWRLGNSTSDSSEELLQRGSREDRYARFWFGSMAYHPEYSWSHLCLVFKVNIRNLTSLTKPRNLNEPQSN